MASSYPAYDSRQPNPHPPAQGYMRRDVSSSDSDLSETNDVRPLNPTNYSKTDVRVDMRQISRTPSPTPSEAAELNRTQLIDYKAMMQKSFWMRREWLCTFIISPTRHTMFLLSNEDRVLCYRSGCPRFDHPNHRLPSTNREQVAARCQLDA